MRYEICFSWSASSNYHFQGQTDWMDAGEFDSAEECEKDWEKGGPVSEALTNVLEASGFEWSLEVREAQDEG